MAITPRVLRTIASGLVGAVQGGTIAAIYEGIFNNEPVLEAFTKRETLYFAGIWAAGSILYHGALEIAGESRQRNRQRRIEQYRAERGR